MTKTIRALVVDDDVQIRELLGAYLIGFGIQADGVGDGRAMRASLNAASYDIVILDLMLPDEDGLSLCRELRAQTTLPVIMLTARGETADRVVGLELGADDYIVKPFDPRELVARIHTILRRVGEKDFSAINSSLELNDAVHFNGWILQRAARQLTAPDHLVVPLSHAEFRLLWAFIEKPRRVLSREQLLDAARGKGSDVFDRSIDLLVSRLRQKLGDDSRSPLLIKTIRGEGYLFDAQISVQE
jgi:two-component system OmpR family response regulator